jgi:cation diffusion facilitator family transporter
MPHDEVTTVIRRRLLKYLRRDSPLHASTISLLACILVATGSIIIGTFESSLVVQTNGLIAIIDVISSLLFLAAVERSTRAPDLSFNYGYGKYESLAILVSATLLIVVTGFTIGNFIDAIQDPPESADTWLLFAWTFLSFIIMRATATRLEEYAKRHHQPMLRYDADLWRADSWVEVGVIFSIVGGGVLLWADHINAALLLDGIASIALLVFTLKVPLQHGREAFRQILDRTLPDKMQYEIIGIIAENHDRMCEFKSVHTRQSGRDIFIEIDLVMPFDQTLEQLYDLEDGILKSLHGRFPTAIPRVYVTPCDRSCVLPQGTTCPVKRT